MFGPDICGSEVSTHLIVNHKGTNYPFLKKTDAINDNLAHLYTLIIYQDKTFKILIDSNKKASGSLLQHFGILPPEEINDPSITKPVDWVDK